MVFFDKFKKNIIHDEPINTSAYKKILRLIDNNSFEEIKLMAKNTGHRVDTL